MMQTLIISIAKYSKMSCTNIKKFIQLGIIQFILIYVGSVMEIGDVAYAVLQ